MIPEFYIDSLSIKFSTIVSDDDFKDLVAKIKQRHQVILFKSYWNHEVVKILSSRYINCLDDDDLGWYIRFLMSMIEKRTNTHWIERINLFHSFGLTARKNPELMTRIIAEQYLPRCKGNINNFVDYSAINMMSLSENPKFTPLAITQMLMENVQLMQGIGNYNINYYNNVIELSKILTEYIGTKKEVIVPQTIASVMSVMIGTEYDEEEIDSVQDVISKLSKNAKNTINKLYKMLK